MSETTLIKTTLTPRTKEEFVELADQLYTSRQILDAIWDTVEMLHVDPDSDESVVTAAAVQVWASPAANNMDEVYESICSEDEEEDIKFILDDLWWASQKFMKLMERHGEFNEKGCRVVNKFVQDEHSHQVESRVEKEGSEQDCPSP